MMTDTLGAGRWGMSSNVHVLRRRSPVHRHNESATASVQRLATKDGGRLGRLTPVGEVPSVQDSIALRSNRAGRGDPAECARAS